MERFNVGTRVKLITHYYGDSHTNPIWNGERGQVMGTIREIHESALLQLKVDWDNGGYNGYKPHDLKQIDTPTPYSLDDDLFTI